jgi:hypothetical protein
MLGGRSALRKLPVVQVRSMQAGGLQNLQAPTYLKGGDTMG